MGRDRPDNSSHHQQFRSGSHALFCSRNIGNIQRAIRILAGSSKTDSRNLDIHISGRTYSHSHDHEKEFVPQYLCSFIVGFVFGKMLDIHEMWIGALPTALPWRILYFVISYILICIGIALSNRCGLPIIPTDLFPRELSEIISAKYSKVKISFDVICLATTAAMTGFILGHIYGLGIGTVLAAFTMGKGIAIVGNAMDKHVTIAPYITAHIKRHGSHKAQYVGH